MDPTQTLPEGFARLSVNPQHEAISQDNTPSLNRVAPERDRFTDEDHKPLDAEIMETFSAFRKINEEPGLPALLSVITNVDERLVSLSPRETGGLLTRQPSITTVLQKAWKEASFKEVRQLEILWPAVPAAPKWRQRRFNEDAELTNQALESAWRDTYIGNNHRLLFANINAILRTKKPYSNQIAIVQSSGTGKSRMVHEQANVVFTIPFNLRKSDEKQDLAFPAPDDAVRDYLVKTSLPDDQNNLKTNYLKFLAGVFKQVNDELEKCQKQWTAKEVRTSEDLAKWWSKHLEGVRTRLYKAAIDRANEEIEILPEIQQKHEDLFAKRRSKPKGSEDSDHTDYDLNRIMPFAAAESARVALEQIIDKLKGFEGSQRIKLIIYFDEAHPLTEVVPKKDDEKTLYDFLCSCLNELLESPIFCIFLSTNSSLAQFAAPRALAKSARILGGEAVTHAPITETPFDCYEDFMVKPGELTLEVISTIPFMARFGRPLFWTLLRGAGLQAPHLHTEILELARAKLVGSREIDNRYETFSRTAKLAVLDIQLCLDFEPRREKVQMEEAALVESHMRFAYSVPDHREYLRSGYPSEPLLAEAAAQQLRTWRTQDPFIVVKTLTDILETGLLDRGELGELTGRQLLLDAYHRAVELEQHDRPEKTPPNFSAGCRLTSFITMLYTEECANRVLDSTPDNLKGDTFRKAFKDALICFTHFGKMADDTGITSTAAWAAFTRHMAIMCRNGQHTVDCILPVLLQDTFLCEHVMTGVLVQFKRQIKGGTVAELSIDQAKIGFFPKTSEKCTHGSIPTPYRPYISLIMELGVQVKTPEEARTATVFKTDSSKKKKSDNRPDHATPSKLHIPLLGLPRHHLEPGHARYNIFAYGCSPTVYRGIDARHKASYALLLSSRDFLGEHPRKDAQSLKAVRRMKPFWNGGEDCYHWVEHDNILHGPVTPRREEFFVGKSIGAGEEQQI